MKVPYAGTTIEVNPTKIVALAKNYRAHAAEMGGAPPEQPQFFLKPPSSLIPDHGTIVLPAASSRVDYEVELALIVKERIRKRTPEEIAPLLLGYSIIIDVTARDLQQAAQQAGMPWTIAKGYDTFAPFGPVIVPREAIDPDHAEIWLKVNDAVRQQGTTANMVFHTRELVSYISSIMTLEPFDIIATGTPEGVGPLQNGDRVEAGVSGIGILHARVARRTS